MREAVSLWVGVEMGAGPAGGGEARQLHFFEVVVFIYLII